MPADAEEIEALCLSYLLHGARWTHWRLIKWSLNGMAKQGRKWHSCYWEGKRVCDDPLAWTVFIAQMDLLSKGGVPSTSLAQTNWEPHCTEQWLLLLERELFTTIISNYLTLSLFFITLLLLRLQYIRKHYNYNIKSCSYHAHILSYSINYFQNSI